MLQIPQLQRVEEMHQKIQLVNILDLDTQKKEIYLIKFNLFKNKNFAILGVSLDDSKSAWLNAINKDNLTWTHISDLKRWESEVVLVYGFAETGIPFNVLVDPTGKIVAQALRGDALESKLAEVLK